MPKKGLEPPHPCGYMDLNHARLPIPPLRQVTAMRGGRGRLEGRCYGIYSTGAIPGVKPEELKAHLAVSSWQLTRRAESKLLRVEVFIAELSWQTRTLPDRRIRNRMQ